LTKTDREALQRALDIAMRDRDMRRKLTGERWEDAAFLAAHHCQTQALNLQPWERPPMDAEHSDRPLDRGARILLKRLLDAGLSRYEPDPMAALDEAKKTAAK
jgi:hypothetical protein